MFAVKKYNFYEISRASIRYLHDDCAIESWHFDLGNPVFIFMLTLSLPHNTTFQIKHLTYSSATDDLTVRNQQVCLKSIQEYEIYLYFLTWIDSKPENLTITCYKVSDLPEILCSFSPLEHWIDVKEMTSNAIGSIKKLRVRLIPNVILYQSLIILSCQIHRQEIFFLKSGYAYILRF